MIVPTHTSLDQPGILIVDDEDLTRNMLGELLAESDRIVRTASSASEARQILEQHDMDVIVCDHDMPGEDGLSFLSDLCSSHPTLRRILITGHAPENLALRGINEAKLMRYLPKPFPPKQLVDTVSEALRQAKKEREYTDGEYRFFQSVKRGRAALVHFTTLGSLSVFILAFTVAILFSLLYLFKCLLGIDLCPNLHLKDVL
jgi:DNA-binding NtrC family response regulator